MILIFFYARNYIAIVLFPPVYIGVSSLLSSSFTPDEIVTKLQNFTVFIVAASRVRQFSLFRFSSEVWKFVLGFFLMFELLKVYSMYK